MGYTWTNRKSSTVSSVFHVVSVNFEWCISWSNSDVMRNESFMTVVNDQLNDLIMTKDKHFPRWNCWRLWWHSGGSPLAFFHYNWLNDELRFCIRTLLTYMFPGWIFRSSATSQSRLSHIHHTAQFSRPITITFSRILKIL